VPTQAEVKVVRDKCVELDHQHAFRAFRGNPYPFALPIIDARASEFGKGRAWSDRFIVMTDCRCHQLRRNRFNRNLRDRRHQGAPLNLSLYICLGIGSGTNAVPEAGAPGAWSFVRDGKGGVDHCETTAK
jgi:hypothetical protein